MDTDTYRKQLEHLANEFRLKGADASIRGIGIASFLVVDLGDRGAEVYGGGDSGFVDPAENGELLGEVQFESIRTAADSAWHWLKDAVRPSNNVH